MVRKLIISLELIALWLLVVVRLWPSHLRLWITVSSSVRWGQEQSLPGHHVGLQVRLQWTWVRRCSESGQHDTGSASSPLALYAPTSSCPGFSDASLGRLNGESTSLAAPKLSSWPMNTASPSPWNRGHTHRSVSCPYLLSGLWGSVCGVCWLEAHAAYPHSPHPPHHVSAGPWQKACAYY